MRDRSVVQRRGRVLREAVHIDGRYVDVIELGVPKPT